jgi:hypothetical protein
LDGLPKRPRRGHPQHRLIHLGTAAPRNVGHLIPTTNSRSDDITVGAPCLASETWVSTPAPPSYFYPQSSLPLKGRGFSPAPSNPNKPVLQPPRERALPQYSNNPRHLDRSRAASRVAQQRDPCIPPLRLPILPTPHRPPGDLSSLRPHRREGGHRATSATAPGDLHPPTPLSS